MADLAKKLGIKSGQAICLLDAPHETAILLRRECPEGVDFSDSLGSERYDVIMLWPAQLDGLAERLAQLQHHIPPGGAVWAILPKKQFAHDRGIDFSWADMQRAALQTDLVDNKVVSLSAEEYATRFVIRKSRRRSQPQ